MRHRAGILAVVLGWCMAAAAADMPFIEVDPGRMTCLRECGTRRAFVAVGVNYFDHQTGWAPKIWRQFDDKRVAAQLDLLKAHGFNTVRVFLSLAEFHREPGIVAAEGEAKFRRLLDLCRTRGLYVIPTGPDHWEGTPGRRKDRFSDEATLAADEAWWKAFAARFRDEPVILAWDLLNEPSVAWDTPAMRPKWNAWLRASYGIIEHTALVWGRPIEEVGEFDEVQPPPQDPAPNDRRLLDYQRFRESLADAWTSRHVGAIRSVDRNHLVTVGHIQWSVPLMLPTVWHYSGFDMRQNARHVDFVTIHFYPINPPRPCDTPEGFDANLAYLQGILHACVAGKPVMLGEFGWYGGGPIGRDLPAQPPEHQLAWCEQLLTLTHGRLCGWLNWAMADTPTSTDLTRWSGVWTEDLRLKPWGGRYSAFAQDATREPAPERPWPEAVTGVRWDRHRLLTDPGASRRLGEEFRAAWRLSATLPGVTLAAGGNRHKRTCRCHASWSCTLSGTRANAGRYDGRVVGGAIFRSQMFRNRTGQLWPVMTSGPRPLFGL